MEQEVNLKYRFGKLEAMILHSTTRLCACVGFAVIPPKAELNENVYTEFIDNVEFHFFAGFVLPRN